MEWKRHALDLLFPPRCISCRVPTASAHELCAECWDTVRFVHPPYCTVCALPLEFDMGEETTCAKCSDKQPFYDSLRTVFHYDEHSQKLVTRYKYSDATYMTERFAKWMFEAAKDCLTDHIDFVVPVPLHWRRSWRRGYNQSALLARRIAAFSGAGYAPDMLKRTRHTSPQASLNQRQRRRNVKQAFALHKRYADEVKDAHIMLVDDVMTTGATLEACVASLRQAGAKEVHLLTLARRF